MFFLFLFLFLFIFPKGGFKIHDIPLTWGYFLLGLTSIYFLFRDRYVLHLKRLQCYMMLVPFQIVSFFSILYNGFEDCGFFLAFWVSFLVLPFSFFILFSEAIEKIDMQFFSVLIRHGLLLIASYGIFLFFYKLINGYFIEIPFLTVNGADVGFLETEKCNDRGEFFKLFSTYNNGNLYGICILMFLPYYNYLEKSYLKKFVVLLSLILTLSRTVWIGFLIEEFWFCFYKPSKSKKVFLSLMVSLWVGLLWVLIQKGFFMIDFLFDAKLGGRSHQLDYLVKSSFLSFSAFDSIDEMIYLGVLRNFGWLGLSCFLVAMIGPVFITLRRQLNNTLESRCLLAGLVIYLLVACSDGGILYIPTMVFYWFIVTLALKEQNISKMSIEGKIEESFIYFK